MRLGTRGSALALAQARLVADALGGAEIVPIKTSGDAKPATADAGASERHDRLFESRASASGARRGFGGDKARFVRGIEQALIAGEVDLGVHSAKDLPTELPGELELVGVPAREDPADAYVGEAASLDEVREGARVGTSSLRRRAQLLAARPDLDVEELRGNVDTRLRRLAERDFDGIVLAAAGLRRLGRDREIAFRFDAAAMTPAAGQGALALEARREDAAAKQAAARITSSGALVELTVERTAVAELDASCRTPLGVRAELTGAGLRADAFVGLPDGSEWVRDSLEGSSEDPNAIGRRLAERLLSAGAADVLERAAGLI
jgi:hydroxymethylbilane synthase